MKSPKELAEIADFKRRHNIMAQMLAKGKLVYIEPGKELSNDDARIYQLKRTHAKP